MLATALNQLLAFPRSTKRIIAVLVDVCLLVGTVSFAFWIRLDELVRPKGVIWLPYIASVVLALPLFVKLGMYRAIFRHAGLRMLLTIGLACGIYGLAFATLFTFVGVTGVPRTLGILQPLLLLLAVIGSRASIRILLDLRSAARARNNARRPVLIYGAGDAGRQLAAAARMSNDLEVVAFIDDDPTLQGGIINGLDVVGFHKLSEMIDLQQIDEILLAQPNLTKAERQKLTQRILSEVAGRRVSIRTLPTLLQIADGRVTVSDLREIEIDDLLGRESIPPNTLLMARNISEKTVLVTGAGGSIGRELCLQIFSQRPLQLILVEASEYNLYSIQQDLATLIDKSDAKPTKIIPLLGSVQNAEHMMALVKQWEPDTIYHAAAYKHVPLVEGNIAQGVLNNVFGTLNMALAAQRAKVADFVLISTDKAVRPTNVMGATKRLAEQILQALAAQSRKTRFTIVRFGNVLGSSGSVVPLFKEQIRSGGPITLTHSEVTRYFMTIPEAAQLVIQAGAMGRSGEVFVLDMGEPVKISEMARLMIELSGLSLKDEANPDGDIEIREVGMRPGEKLYEELLIGNDPLPTNHPRIMRASEPFIPWPRLEIELNNLERLAAIGDHTQLLAHLHALIPEFVPAEHDRSAEKRELAS